MLHLKNEVGLDYRGGGGLLLMTLQYTMRREKTWMNTYPC